MALGLAILLSILVGFPVKALLDATDEIIDEFENESVVLLDLHAGMLALVTLVGASLEEDPNAPGAIAPLMQSMDDNVALLQGREFTDPGEQHQLVADATALWLQAQAVIPGLLEIRVGADDPSVFPM